VPDGHHDRLPGASGHLEGRAWQIGVRGIIRIAYRVLNPGIAVFLSDLGDVDGGFEGFVLAEEELLLAAAIGPVADQPSGGGSYADVSALAPQGNAPTDVVDQLVLFYAVLGPLRFELKLPRTPLLRLGEGKA